jgi:hypothetical protein
LTIISTVHTKTWFRFFAKEEENISQRTEILAMIEKKKKRLFKNNNCVLKKLNDGNTIYLPPKIKRLSYFVLSGLLFFIAKRNLW